MLVIFGQLIHALEDVDLNLLLVVLLREELVLKVARNLHVFLQHGAHVLLAVRHNLYAHVVREHVRQNYATQRPVAYFLGWRLIISSLLRLVVVHFTVFWLVISIHILVLGLVNR